MDLWDELKIESVYRRLRMLAVVFLVPINVSLLEVIIQGNSKIFIPIVMGGAIPLQVITISPLAITFLTPSTVVPTVTVSTLLLTAVFLISLAGATMVGWYMAFISFVRYTPGYNNFADVKRGINRLLHGTRKDKGMLALFTAVLISIYIGFSLSFVVDFAYIFPDDPLIPIAILCFLFAGVTVIPSWNYVKDALNR